MQVLPTSDQLRWVKDWFGPIIIPVLVWVWKHGIKKLKENLNEIITENVNRVRDETIAYMRGQFKLHLACDEEQFNALRKAMNLPPYVPTTEQRED
jgi:hypothetical protein